ncbi:MAG: hypothetical protein LBH19_04795 [Dysgonamonadaceae bacterium]|jgi:hypothetical protein|nr:hypothetical protein [Dysgonamonadaceae bacterium]
MKRYKENEIDCLNNKSPGLLLVRYSEGTAPGRDVKWQTMAIHFYPELTESELQRPE